MKKQNNTNFLHSRHLKYLLFPTCIVLFFIRIFFAYSKYKSMFIIQPCRHIHGYAQIPPSKSHTLRAILWASVAKGRSFIQNYLTSPDTEVMLRASSQLGCQIVRTHNLVTIDGSSQATFPTQSRIDAGSSGIAFRFLTALASVSSKEIMIHGETQLERRPILPLIQALSNLGAHFHLPSTILPPFIVSGPLSGGHTYIDGKDSQYASALTIACSLSKTPSSFTIIQPKEIPWFQLSLWWLKQLDISFSTSGQHTYSFPGEQRPNNFSYQVPGDFSSAAFLAAAAILSFSSHSTQLLNLNIQDIQGDKSFFLLMKNLGAHIDFSEHSITIHPSSFKGGEIDMDSCIDALPILATLCCFAETPSRLYNAEGAKNKESNRVEAIAQELTKMGACIHVCHDGLMIEPRQLHGAELNSHHDHRIAMALTIAAMYATGESKIYHTHCVRKTFPHFVTTLKTLNADIKEIKELE